MLVRIFIKLLLISFTYLGISYAYPIQEIVIQGNSRVDSEYIKALMISKEGINYSEDNIGRDLRILYGTDFFSNIKINFEKGILTVEVIENPLIDNLTFKGNKKIKTDLLTKEITLKRRSAFSLDKLNLDIQRITELYYKSGYLGASVSYTITEKEGKRIDVTIDIKEGKKTTIDQVVFLGNMKYSNTDLQNEIITKPSRWWRVLNPGDVYDRSRIQYDGELLRQFYFENGYPNFSLVSTYTEISPNNNKFIVTYTLSEGERYRFGDVVTVIEVPSLKEHEDEINSTIILDKSRWFKNSLLQREINKLKNKILGLGYQFINVGTQLVFNDITRTVDIVVIISEEKRVFVSNIDITGNTKTIDKVVRREIKFAEEDAYSQDNINTALRNLYRTGYFSNANIIDKPSGEDGKINLDVTVEETSTGSISAGGGYSTLDRFNIEASYAETNAFGTGKFFSVSLLLASTANTYAVTLADPYFLDNDLYVSGSIFRRETGVDTFRTGGVFNSSNILYKRRDQGASVSTGYALTDNIRQTWGYSLYERTVTNIKSGVSLSIKELEGSSLVSSVSHTVSYDGRDNAIYPTAGIDASFVTEYAGMFGDINYIRNTFRGIWYYQIYENIVFSALASAGAITGLNGQKVHIVDKYTLGGPTLRGFAAGTTFGGVGPYDTPSKESIGGIYMYRGSFQLEAPIPGVKNYGLIVYTFTDFGTVTDFNNSRPDIIDSGTIRVSAGVGISWKSPAGIISLDLGYPVKKEPNDRVERIFVNFGTRL